MGIYKPKRRTAEGQEEIKLPISSVDISSIDLQKTSNASIESNGIFVLRDGVISGLFPLTNPPKVQPLVLDKIPIIPGNNVTFELANNGQCVKINSLKSMDGTWELYDEYNSNADIEFNFSGYDSQGNERQFNRLRILVSSGKFSVTYFTDDGSAFIVHDTFGNEWINPKSKIITITEEPADDKANLIKSIAKRKEPAGVEEIKNINTCIGDMEEVFDEGDGISWSNSFNMRNGSAEVVTAGPIAQKIPISAGDGITFEKDEDTNTIKINSIYDIGDSVIGTWKFKNYISMNGSTRFNIRFICNGSEYVAIADEGDGIYFYNSDGEGWTVYYYDEIWEDAIYKTIKIIEEPSEEASAWIKASARKKPPIGVDEVNHIDTWWSGRDNVSNDGDGISWSNGFCFMNGMGSEIATGSISQSIPLVAGNNVTFSYDEEYNAIAINATGGGGSGLPQIRFANCVFDEDIGVYRFTVENMGGGTLQEGDKLQICCRRKYPGGKKKLRMMTEVIISEADINQRFLKIEVNPLDEGVNKWLFKNDRLSDRASTLSAIYFRFKRVTKYDSDGMECNAIFSNVETVWKTYELEWYDGQAVPIPGSLRIK